MNDKKALGRGLSSLIPSMGGGRSDSFSKQYLEVNIEEVLANQDQPRKLFEKESLDELALSIKEKGIIQPLIVRKFANNKFELVAGERRLRAAKQAGLTKVPIIIKDIDENEVLELALIENIQRQDLNPIEEALAYKELLNKHQYTQDELAQRLGKDRSSISNTMRLLKLPESVRELIINGKLSMGHARALVVLEDTELQERVAKKIVEHGLSVREVENLARDLKENGVEELSQIAAVVQKNKKVAPYKDLEEQLKSILKTKVQIKGDQKKGKLVLHFHSPEELDSIYQKLAQS